MKKNKKDYIGSVKVKHKWLWLSLLAVFLLGWAAFMAINIYANALNITEIGQEYLSIYLKDIKLGILCYSLAFIVSMLAFSATSIALKRNLLEWEETAFFLKSKTGFFILNAVFSFITTYSLPYNIPRSAMIAANPTWFVHADPLYGKNIGYYVFQRPFFTDISNWLLMLTAAVLIYTIIIYFMYYVRNGAGGLKVFAGQPQIINHVACIILGGYLVSAFSGGFSAEYLMLDNTLKESRGGFTDIMVWSNYYKFLPFLITGILILSIIFMAKKSCKNLIYSILIYPVSWILVGIYALGVQTFYVTPNKATIERPYTKYRIESTNRAYGLDGVREYHYPLTGKITAESVSENASLIDSLVVTESQPALNMISAKADSKQFYLFKNADLVPDTTDGRITAKYSAAREIFLPEDNKTLNEYNNSKMHYTHGYGTESVSAQNVPLAKSETIAQPRIYFGETEKDFRKDYIITGTAIGEYDYESGGDSTTFSYDGPAGVKLSFFNRLIYALRYKDSSILFSGNITENSKILFNRNVVERARIALPFLTYDDDPYLVESSDGRLVWIVDGYTSTNSFPYAVKLFDLDEDFGTNYIRNSVKITVDAYTGEVKAYIIDWDDPIIRTLSKVYHDVFLSSSLPEEIASHLKYPKKLFEMQSNIYKTYHDTNPQTFYTKDNSWEYAMSKSGEKSSITSLSPYYQIINTVDGVRDLSLISAFTPAGKSENLAALFTASSDINNYGKLTLYTFPKNTNVFGTLQIENKIASDNLISEELDKLSSEGAIVFGPLRTLPIMDTICYIKPVYVNSGFLQLKKVIVSCGESVAIDTNLISAFRHLASMNPKSDYSFEPIVEQQPGDENYTPAEYNSLVIAALDKYSEAKQFSAENDWVNYGKAMDEFEDLIDEIRYDINYPAEESLGETEQP